MLADGCLKREVVASMPTRYPSFPNPEIHVGYSFSACFLFVSARFGTIWKQLECIFGRILRHLQALWKHFRSIFEAFWMHLEAFSNHLEACWKHLEAFGIIRKHLEAFWSILEAFGRIWNILETFGSILNAIWKQQDNAAARWFALLLQRNHTFALGTFALQGSRKNIIVVICICNHT